MSNPIKFKIDGKDCIGKEGQLIIDAAIENGVYIPYLCHMKDVVPAGSCRICQIKMNGRTMAACTTPLENTCENLNIEMDTPELNDIRKAIVELLFVEGNHFCPSCEKSGNCELQALGYKYNMLVPRFPYAFPQREVFAASKYIYVDRNRCILCKKCIRTVKDEKGQSVFAFRNRGNHLEINVDAQLADKLTAEQAQKAMDVCPVGAILRKEKGFDVPIGKRKFDKNPIGVDNLSSN
jgi:[NiFe] hydrogenase diaphorase moiety small subunit